MLEGLFNQLATKPPSPAMTVPSVPSSKKHGEPLQAANYKAVPLVPPVPSEKTETKVEIGKAVISTSDRQKLLDYMAAISETDQDIIDEYLTECGKDTALLARQLQQADDCLRIRTGDYTGLVQCSGCRELDGDSCQLHGWRVVVEKWRRCDVFKEPNKTSHSHLITCKSCGHFQSFNHHGGGAGACTVGVMPFGACGWANTRHECEKYQANY